MFTSSARQGTRPRSAARHAGLSIRRFAAVLTALACGLLAPVVIVPAAFAMTTPIGDGGTSSVAPLPATAVQVITKGGMAGWQITSIALGAALLGAAVTVLLYRALAVRRSPAATA